MKKNENIKNIIKEQSSFFSFEGELSIYEDYNLTINYKTNNSINNYPVYIYNEAFINILLIMGIEKFSLNLNEPINIFLNKFQNKEITLLNVLKDNTGLVDVYGVLANKYELEFKIRCYLYDIYGRRPISFKYGIAEYCDDL